MFCDALQLKNEGQSIFSRVRTLTGRPQDQPVNTVVEDKF